MGLILWKNGWRGGLDMRLLSSASARADVRGDGGPLRGFHLFLSLSNGTCGFVTPKHCLVLLFFTWAIYSRTVFLLTLEYSSGGWFWAPRWQNRSGTLRLARRRIADRLGTDGVRLQCWAVSKLGHVAGMLTWLSPLLHIISIIFVTFWCFWCSCCDINLCKRHPTPMC